MFKLYQQVKQVFPLKCLQNQEIPCRCLFHKIKLMFGSNKSFPLTVLLVQTDKHQVFVYLCSVPRTYRFFLGNVTYLLSTSPPLLEYNIEIQYIQDWRLYHQLIVSTTKLNGNLIVLKKIVLLYPKNHRY